MLLTLIILLLLAATANAISWNDLRVTFNQDPDKGYYQLPRRSRHAVLKGWSQPPEVMNDPAYDILCPDKDPTVCVIYSKESGNCNGVQIGIQRQDTRGPYDFSHHHMFEPATRFGYEIYLITMYTLKPGRLSDASWRKKLYIERGPDDKPMYEIPTTDEGMEKTPFVLQNCVPGMGDHYYYNVSKDLSCMDFEPMFGLFKGGEMVGFGIQTFGKPVDICRPWFEVFGAELVKPTLPDSPDCLTDWAAEYGLVSIHVFFIDKPWKQLTCK